MAQRFAVSPAERKWDIMLTKTKTPTNVMKRSIREANQELPLLIISSGFTHTSVYAYNFLKKKFKMSTKYHMKWNICSGIRTSLAYSLSQTAFHVPPPLDSQMKHGTKDHLMAFCHINTAYLTCKNTNLSNPSTSELYPVAFGLFCPLHSAAVKRLFQVFLSIAIKSFSPYGDKVTVD